MLLDEKANAARNEDDSSYDSDSSDTFLQKQAKQYDEVSRTSSGTLSVDYSDEDYVSKVEFGRKLGYCDDVIHTALAKLGSNPAQNDLLNELIKISKSSNKDPFYQNKDSKSILIDVFKTPVRLRPIVIDGSNVAMSHGNKEIFSCRGIKLCVDWFRARGHEEITVFVPKWRKEMPRLDNPISEQDILYELEHERLLVFTPSRLVCGKRLVCYDDRYILRLAADNGGIVVSNDNYRDLVQENPEFRIVVEKNILMYSFVNDKFMPPEDPLGRSGPNLDTFLTYTIPNLKSVFGVCPYGKKCTYGYKCKYDHPEFTFESNETISEYKNIRKNLNSSKLKSLSVPLNSMPVYNKTSLGISKSNILPVSSNNLHKKLQRQLTLNPNNDSRLSQFYNSPNFSWHQNVIVQQTPVQTAFQDARRKLQYHLSALFPEYQVLHVMQMRPEETNAQKLCAAILATFPQQ